MTLVQPLRCDGDASVATQVQVYLRKLVLNGTLAPGLAFSQVELARELGVSRTPLREALRMLQEEGLVQAEPNRKARVSECNAAELDAVYASRVSLEAVAVGMTAMTRSSEMIVELEGLLDRMQDLGGDANATDFEVQHRRFHRLLVMGSPPMFVQMIQGNQDRAERYWRLMSAAEPGPHLRRDREHRDIVDAVRAQDQAAAAACLARHLARTALTVVTHMSPEEDSPATRAALRPYTDAAKRR